MTANVESIVGSVVALTAQRMLTQGVGGARPALRVTGFKAEETVAAVQHLLVSARPAIEGLIVKVGTRQAIEGIPGEMLLGDEETLTYWRNREVSAILLFDWDVQGDQEGLAAITRLDDYSLLNSSDSDEVKVILRDVVGSAWKAVAGTATVPSKLTSVLSEVREAIVPNDRLSLRRWVAYVLKTCELANSTDLLTPELVSRAAGEALFALGLFADHLLFDVANAARSRLTKNLNVSDLRQPSGAAIADDDLRERIESFEPPQTFLASSGLSVETTRALMRRVLQGGDEARASIDLQLWLLLFDRRPDRRGLGSHFREDLARQDSTRVEEFDDLEVEPGLNDSDQEAAERLVRAEPPEDLAALVEIVSPKLRRQVQKVAFPDAQLAPDPLRAILHGVHVLDDGEEHSVALKLEGLTQASPWTRWLFAILYGRTLLQMAELTVDSRLQFAVDGRLCNFLRPEDGGSADEFDPAEAWGPVRLCLEMNGVGARRFRWDPSSTPGLPGLGALLSGLNFDPGQKFETGFDNFFDGLLLPTEWASRRGESRPLGPFSARLSELRHRHAAAWREGIDADLLDAYVAAWEPVVNEARAILVPANSPDQDLAGVVLTDILQLSDDKLVMLGSHPLRLRWLASHLRRMTELSIIALSRGLNLNLENTELFFEWIQRISPHGTPPLVVGEDETVAIAVRESAGHEEYTPISGRASQGRDWLAAVDDAAVDELVKVSVSYVETYPHKRDGLVVLLLDRDGTTQLPTRLARRLRARVSGVRLELIVFSDRRNHHDLVQAFDSEFGEDELPEGRLFPEVQLLLQHWSTESDPDLRGFIDRVDLALAPALFGTRTTLHAKTKDSTAFIAGKYDPLLHDSSHDLRESSQNVVRAMLPSQSDPLLESWSTLCVRHDAHSAVAPQQELNTDYFEMQVRFDQRQKLFIELHRIAHWVVTLDAFVGRDQIDALEDKPDVILVRPGVGKNEAYTLIVSSGTGRRFVAKRLGRKLAEMRLVEGHTNHVAERIYDVGRNVVPGAVLRALGIGSAASEIVGLVASRFAVERWRPSSLDRPHLVVWLSFDELQDWFGRVQRTRADLGRFTFTLEDDDTMRLDILVVESKFRQIFDVGIAEQQLDRTIDLCRAAFASGDTTPDDSAFWLQELAAAIERTSGLVLPSCDLPARTIQELGTQSLMQTVMGSIFSGQIVLGEVGGVAVAIAAANESPAPPIGNLGRHSLLRINRLELKQIIECIVRREEPSARIWSLEDSGGHIGARPFELSDAASNGTSVDGAGTSQSDLRPGQKAAEENGLGASELRRRYEQLLDVLDQHKVAVEPALNDPWIEGPGFYVLRVTPQTGITADRVVNRVKEIALALRLPSELQIRTSLDRGNIVFEVPKSPDERYAASAQALWDRCPVDLGRLKVPVGVDISGEAVSIEFSSPDSPHLLVAGTTGSGKSVALETILRGLCRYPEELVRLRLVDPKGTELLDFEEDPHVDGAIGVYPEDAIEMLEAAVMEMENRYLLMRPVRARSLVDYNMTVEPEDRKPWVIIVLDEYADLTSDPTEKAAIEGLLRRLAAKARAAGIHIIAATQRPSADVISTTIRSNLPSQLALRVKTATDSRIIMDESGAEALAGQGDAFLRTARGVRRIQVAWAG
ncbi:FtsK/SpoIIIE domain-containing protein [Williamsia muralis]|uniref:FtsK domain-containing protein n=1 Tax=Williamsia marianensis TaxID=85044 RepID=A0A2G3PRQ2_WILMA|nr:FtsK/SpoIIIE domain-containing protein [Williamsia marianensis]PHV68456.1 hypothetical protein CSW57_04360 [Williamsia marianensis]